MKAETIQAGEGETIEVYGVRRKLLGHYTEDGGPYCRLLFEGGKVYWFAVPYGKGNEAPTGEPPHSVIEAADGNGDMLTYSDGKTYRTGGALIPFSAEDAAFLHNMKNDNAEIIAAVREEGEATRQTFGEFWQGLLQKFGFIRKRASYPRTSQQAKRRAAEMWRKWQLTCLDAQRGTEKVDCYEHYKKELQKDRIESLEHFKAVIDNARK